MLCGICAVQIQHRKCVLDHANYTAPTRQRDVQIMQIIKTWDLSFLKGIYRELGSDACDVRRVSNPQNAPDKRGGGGLRDYHSIRGKLRVVFAGLPLATCGR